MAAASVTRAISMVSMRLSIYGPPENLKPLDPDRARRGCDMSVSFDSDQGLTHGWIECLMCDKHEGGVGALLRGSFLHDAFDRYFLIRQDSRDGRYGTRLVVELERHVIAAFMGALRRRCVFAQILRRKA